VIALVFFIVFIGLCAIFSGLEMAYISRDRVSHMARMGGRIGFFYGTMPREVMATVLLCNNLVMVGATVAATNLFLGFTGRVQSATLATVLSTLSILVLGEIIPKALARSQPERFIGLFGPVIWWAWRIGRPVVAGLLKVVRVDLDVSPKAEVRELVERMLWEGRITEKEARIATRGLSLSDISLSDACDRNFRLFTDEAGARAALLAQPSFTPVVATDEGFLVVDVKALFAGRRETLIRLHRMNGVARVTAAMAHMRKGEAVAVVDAEGGLVGLLTPQSLLARVIS
jgi:CBS domain containing-hemolysin-like protein